MAGIKVATEKESSSSLNREKEYAEEAAGDEYYDFENYNGEVDYLEVDQDGLMSYENQTLLMPPGMRLKNY